MYNSCSKYKSARRRTDKRNTLINAHPMGKLTLTTKYTCTKLIGKFNYLPV